MGCNANIEIWLRGGLFISLLVLLLLAESLWPRRKRVATRTSRWTTNFGIAVINTLALRVLGPLTAVTAAVYASSRGWGWLNQVEWPNWAKFIIAIALLDLAIYAQHVATHKIPILWRLHKMHHADRDFDASTALRFHPVEIVLSMIYKAGLVLIIGPAALAVIIFEVLLNGCAMFNHANLYLPKWLDRAVRVLLVTPDMHRVHHSVRGRETNSNYGFCVPWWDWIFRTYRAQPQDGHDNMTIGLPDYQSDGPNHILWSLILPFKR